jgi:hypothetical protein
MSDRTVTNEQLDKDFENNEVFPWVEDSQNGVQWKIENKSSPWEMKNIAPQPLSGGNYLRVHRGISFSSFGVAVLRSPTFTLLPGQLDFSFSFWIRSKWSQVTNLEVIRFIRKSFSLFPYVIIDVIILVAGFVSRWNEKVFLNFFPLVIHGQRWERKAAYHFAQLLEHQ